MDLRYLHVELREYQVKVHRFKDNPIIRPGMDERMGDNINGPSLIRVPDWVANPLGKYYLYFAHHQGTYIRMAYSDNLEGPWRLHGPGILDLTDSYFGSHVASPDVHVVEESQEIWMYYHGCCMPEPPRQVTRRATSKDGLQFDACPDILGSAYWRAFRWGDYWYTLEMSGRFRRSKDGVSDFEEGPCLFTENMRHSAVHRSQNTLRVFYTNVGDCPERILWISIHLDPDWHSWETDAERTLLTPEENWEGADLPVEPSIRGSVHRRVHQLRDPCVYEEDGSTYLLYSVAGENGIAIAGLTMD